MTQPTDEQLIEALSKPPKYTFSQLEDFSNFVKKFIADYKINPLVIFDTAPLIPLWKKERGIT